MKSCTKRLCCSSYPTATIVLILRAASTVDEIYTFGRARACLPLPFCNHGKDRHDSTMYGWTGGVQHDPGQNRLVLSCRPGSPKAIAMVHGIQHT